VIIVGDFDNPRQSSLGWRDIGPGMSEALSRALLNRGHYDVVIKPTLSRNLQKLVTQPSPERDPTLEQVRAEHPEVDYVVIGAVTDFQHTSDLPEEIAPRTWLGSPRREAIVAIDLIVVDLRNERLVSAEHITGTAPAGKTATRTLYRDVAFGSYVFWNTPLGRASTSAIQRAVARIDSLVPTFTAGPATHSDSAPAPRMAFGSRQARIDRQTSLRGVDITGGRNCGLVPDQIYALLPMNASNDEDKLLRDPDTGRLLLVRIAASNDGAATGWLLGKCADPRQLVSATLRPVPGSTADGSATALRRHHEHPDEPTSSDPGDAPTAVSHATDRNNNN
jgi:curli biogenesis system outer membrane secretion channel CsgG